MADDRERRRRRTKGTLRMADDRERRRVAQKLIILPSGLVIDHPGPHTANLDFALNLEQLALPGAGGDPDENVTFLLHHITQIGPEFDFNRVEFTGRSFYLFK